MRTISIVAAIAAFQDLVFAVSAAGLGDGSSPNAHDVLNVRGYELPTAIQATSGPCDGTTSTVTSISTLTTIEATWTTVEDTAITIATPCPEESGYMPEIPPALETVLAPSSALSLVNRPCSSTVTPVPAMEPIPTIETPCTTIAEPCSTSASTFSPVHAIDYHPSAAPAPEPTSSSGTDYAKPCEQRPASSEENDNMPAIPCGTLATHNQTSSVIHPEPQPTPSIEVVQDNSSTRSRMELSWIAAVMACVVAVTGVVSL